MKITIDDKEIEIFSDDKNIVDVAKRAKISIPAPCYLANKSKGCCKACVVDVDSKNEYACATKPEDGMSVVFKRKDLNEIRKERLLKYRENMKNNDSNSCSCNCECNSN